MPTPSLTSALVKHDRQRLKDIANLIGVDEAGRGALAGPVSAGAVWIGDSFFKSAFVRRWENQINDSKQLTPMQRDEIYDAMLALQMNDDFHFTTATANVKEIGIHNILQATCIAMARAIDKLAKGGRNVLKSKLKQISVTEKSPCQILLDGKPMIRLGYKHEAIVKGDSKSLAIALASIAAKVSRDRHMTELHYKYPEFKFNEHKGYGTLSHRTAIIKNGPCPEHRSLFLRNILPQDQLNLPLQ